MAVDLILMSPQLIFVPKIVSSLGLLVLLVAGIQELKQGHIGRVAIAANAFLLWQIFYESWKLVPDWFAWYLNLGTVVGIIALGTYFAKISLPTEFYNLAYVGYGSFSVILIFIIALSNNVLPI